ncbi:hypothetical protein CVT24_012692 [Panaeolus cyanescens]|uniref:G domain-containing protein n=1 Tax=Panaeolus cyanescens TaxID=181874 RepID=A0A409YK29_9AGAR|nr:hypothetical protein CVT24_012692 [Panaeolus cyanescens]
MLRKVYFNNSSISLNIAQLVQAYHGAIESSRAPGGGLVDFIIWEFNRNSIYFTPPSSPHSDLAATVLPRSSIGVDDLTREDILIVVLGPTGSGKSNFINTLTGKNEVLVGSGLCSCTKDIKLVQCDPLPGKSNRVFLVDTPGFDDAGTSDFSILEILEKWFTDTFQRRIKVSGVLFFHRITENRFAGSSAHNLSILVGLCGSPSLNNVLIVTSLWDEIKPEFLQETEEREKQLESKYWSSLTKHGSRIVRHNGTQASAQSIISKIRPVKLDLKIQCEIVNQNKTLAQTTVGKTIYTRLQTMIEDLSKFISSFHDDDKRHDILHALRSQRDAFHQKTSSSHSHIRFPSLRRRRRASSLPGKPDYSSLPAMHLVSNEAFNGGGLNLHDRLRKSTHLLRSILASRTDTPTVLTNLLEVTLRISLVLEQEIVIEGSILALLERISKFARSAIIRDSSLHTKHHIHAVYCSLSRRMKELEQEVLRSRQPTQNTNSVKVQSINECHAHLADLTKKLGITIPSATLPSDKTHTFQARLDQANEGIGVQLNITERNGRRDSHDSCLVSPVSPTSVNEDWHSAIETLHEDEPSIQELSPNDTFIGLMGLTGSGKSTFINTIMGKELAKVGHSLLSCTQEIDTYTYVDSRDGRRIIFVDTPGFDDTNLADFLILQMITQWLSKTYSANVKLSGILFFHRISDNRMGSTAIHHLEVFLNLCGNSSLANVVLVSNMWDELKEEIAVEREKHLKSVYWNQLIQHGARTARHDATAASCRRIVDLILKAPRNKTTLLIQNEMVDKQLPFHSTSVAATLKKRLLEVISSLAALIRTLDCHHDEARKEVELNKKALLDKQVKRLNKDSPKSRKWTLTFPNFKKPAPRKNTVKIDDEFEIISVSDASPSGLSSKSATSHTSSLSSASFDFYFGVYTSLDESIKILRKMSGVKLDEGLVPGELTRAIDVALQAAISLNKIPKVDRDIVSLVGRLAFFMRAVWDCQDSIDAKMICILKDLLNHIKQLEHIATDAASRLRLLRFSAPKDIRPNIIKCHECITSGCQILQIENIDVQDGNIARLERKLLRRECEGPPNRSGSVVDGAHIQVRPSLFIPLVK